MKLFAGVSALAVALGEDCSNGHVCPDSVCVSRTPSAGARYGCTPKALGPKPTICGDSRFSCPGGFACNGRACVGPANSSVPLYENTNALHLNKTAAPNDSVCDVLRDYVPAFCNCQDSTKGAYGAILTCKVSILGLETIILTADLEPCANPLYLSLDVKELDLGFEWGPEKFSAGYNYEIDIGLDIGIPELGDAGVYLAVEVDGNVDQLELNLGVDVCGTLLGIEECGSSITSDLPIWILDATFQFGSICP